MKRGNQYPALRVRDMENIANADIVNYAGTNAYEDYEGYDGRGDDMVDFGGIERSFRDEIKTGRIYTLTITNVNAATRNALVLPGYSYSQGGAANPAGTISTGAFLDTAGGAGLSGSGNPKSIEEFLSFIMRNPTRIVGIKFSSNVAAQIDQLLTVRTMSPFRDLPGDTIALAAYQDENTFKDKVVTVRFDELQGDNQRQLIVPVVGTSSLTMTIFCGAVLNTSAALSKKAEKALGE